MEHRQTRSMTGNKVRAASSLVATTSSQSPEPAVVQPQISNKTAFPVEGAVLSTNPNKQRTRKRREPTRHAPHELENTGRPPIIADPSLNPGPSVNTSFVAKATPSKKTYDKNAWLKFNTGAQFKTIGRDELRADPSHVDSTSGFENVCSYNWHKASAPSLYVPGAPPQWKPRTLPVTLAKDDGEQFIDQNAYHVPTYPFEPLFRAIPLTNPDFTFNEIDLVANRNSMRKLLNFVNGKVFDPFRIDLSMLHNTLFLTRRERRTREIVSATHHKTGYGHSFEDQFTEPGHGLESSTSHHRVAKYKLGDINCVIRFEVDAWIPDEETDNALNVTGDIARDDNVSAQDDDLVATLQQLSLAKEKKAAKPHDKATRVMEGGTAIDHSRLAELKTKSREPNRADLIPQLWFGRIPYLVIGMHQDGHFSRAEVTETREDFEKFETKQQDQLRKLVHVIKLLRSVTLSSPDRSCVVVCENKIKPLRLDVYSTTKKFWVLPPDLVKTYWPSRI